MQVSNNLALIQVYDFSSTKAFFFYFLFFFPPPYSLTLSDVGFLMLFLFRAF